MTTEQSERKCIYYILFKTSERGYVGQTKNFERRMREHQRENSGCRYLKHAFQFYGCDDCYFYILEDDLSVEEANDKEKFYIKDLGTLTPNGYNLNEGGGSFDMLQETKDLLSDCAIKRWADETFREKMIDIMTSEEYKEKHRNNSTAMWKRPGFREKHAESMQNYWLIQEHVDAAKKRTAKLWEDKAYREKVQLGVQEYWSIQEHVDAAKERTTKLWKDEEFRKKATEGTIAACNTPERKETRKVNAIKAWTSDDYRKKQKETRSSPEFLEKLTETLMSPENVEKRRIKKEQKANVVREAYIRLEGNRKKVSEEIGLAVCTIIEYIKIFKDDEEIQRIKKEASKKAQNTPEMIEKRRKAGRISQEKRRLLNPE